MGEQVITRVPVHRGTAWKILGYDDELTDPNAEMVAVFVEKLGTDGQVHMCNVVMSGIGFDAVGADQAYGMLERALKRKMTQEGVW